LETIFEDVDASHQGRITYDDFKSYLEKDLGMEFKHAAEIHRLRSRNSIDMEVTTSKSLEDFAGKTRTSSIWPTISTGADTGSFTPSGAITNSTSKSSLYKCGTSDTMTAHLSACVELSKRNIDLCKTNFGLLRQLHSTLSTGGI